MARIAADLELPFDDQFEDLLPLFSLSGDSGRTGSTITRRLRRNVPEAVALDVMGSVSYEDLCMRLDYLPEIAAQSY